MSYGAKSELINLENDTDILRQSIYMYEKQMTPISNIDKENKLIKKIKKLNITTSEYYNYNKEFIKINNEIYVRLTLIDAHT